jgi:hypothetical protein
MKAVLKVHNPYKATPEFKHIHEIDLTTGISDSLTLTLMVEKQVGEIVNGMDIDPVKTRNDILLPVYWDETRLINYVLLTYNPRGDIISLVCKSPRGVVALDDLVIDGKFNIAGNRVDFLSEDRLDGYTAECKYLI